MCQPTQVTNMLAGLSGPWCINEKRVTNEKLVLLTNEKLVLKTNEKLVLLTNEKLVLKNETELTHVKSFLAGICYNMQTSKIRS